ncbi:MAG: hypothetical protein ACE5OT_01760 [Candidatus Hadarchaeaceae archaeon]
MMLKKLGLIVICAAVIVGGTIVGLFLMGQRGGGRGLTLVYRQRLWLTTDAEGGGARPEIVFADNHFFVIYLGNVTTVGNRAFKLKVYDREFNEIGSKTLVTSSPEYGGPTDIRVAVRDNYLYAAYEMAERNLGAHLFVAKYALTPDFPLIASTIQPIATGPYYENAQIGDETMDDPAPVVAGDSLYVMTKIRTAMLIEAQTLYRLRKISKSDLSVVLTEDLDLSSAIDGPAGVGSVLYVNGDFWLIESTMLVPPVPPQGSWENANSDIILIKTDGNWQFDAARDIYTLSSTTEREHYPSGARFANGKLYVVYVQFVREPVKKPSGPPKPVLIWLKVFDSNFQLVDGAQVAAGEDFGGNHPTVEVVENKIYVAYGAQNFDDGNRNVVVDIYELVAKG